MVRSLTDDILRTGCIWLMGVPAGFKLNTELAGMLGLFSLNVIQVWSTLMYLLKPLFGPFLYILAIAGMLLGITVPAAMIADMLFLATIHISTLHQLVAFMYSNQLQALAALWRLFRCLILAYITSIVVLLPKHEMLAYWHFLQGAKAQYSPRKNWFVWLQCRTTCCGLLDVHTVTIIASNNISFLHLFYNVVHILVNCEVLPADLHSYCALFSLCTSSDLVCATQEVSFWDMVGDFARRKSPTRCHPAI